MESLQAAGCRLNTVCPQHRDKVAVAAGLPMKPSQVQSHCAAGHRFFFPSLRSLSFPGFSPLCLLVAWGSELPRCLPGIARWTERDLSTWALQRCIPGRGRGLGLFPRPLSLPCGSAEGVQGEGVGSSALRSQSAGDVTPSYLGRAWKEAGLPNSVSCLLLLLSVRPLGFPKAGHTCPAPK